MADAYLPLLVSALAVLAAAWTARRRGDSPRDVRLLAGTGAALGGVALIASTLS